MRAWRDLPGLRDPDRFDAWLHRLLVNSCLDEARRRRRRPIEVEITPIDEPTIGDEARSLADRDLVERALNRLDPEHRALVVLHYYLGYPLRVEELRALLDTAVIEGPYVLVGHSFGGVLAQLFAHRYPADTAGVVFVDASHEAQFERGGWWQSLQPTWGDGSHTVDQAASRSELAEAGDLGDLPMVVLTNGRMTGEIERQWSPLQDALAALSTSHLHMVATEAGHDVHDDRPELVEASIRAVIAAAEAGGSLPVCGDLFREVGAACLTDTMVDLIDEWDRLRAAVVPAGGKLPAGTYGFADQDGTRIEVVLDGGRLAVTMRHADGTVEEFEGDYAADGRRVTIRWPFDWRMPRTPGLNTATWTIGPEGELRFRRLDDWSPEPWLAVPWEPSDQ